MLSLITRVLQLGGARLALPAAEAAVGATEKVAVEAAAVVVEKAGLKAFLGRVLPRLGAFFGSAGIFAAVEHYAGELIDWFSDSSPEAAEQMVISRKRVSDPALGMIYQQLLERSQILLNLNDDQLGEFISLIRFISAATPGLMESRDRHYYAAIEFADSIVLAGVADQTGARVVKNTGGDENPKPAPDRTNVTPIRPDNRRAPGETEDSELYPERRQDNTGGDDMTVRPTVNINHAPVILVRGSRQWRSSLGVNWNRFYRALAVLAGYGPQDVAAATEACKVLGAMNGDPSGWNGAHPDNDVAKQLFIGNIPTEVGGKSFSIQEFDAAYRSVIASDQKTYGHDDFGSNMRQKLRKAGL